MSSNPKEIQNKPLIQKEPKLYVLSKKPKNPLGNLFTWKINSNTNLRIIWNFLKKISNKNINYLFEGNTNATSEKTYSQTDQRKFCWSIIHKKLLQEIQVNQTREENKIPLTILKAIINFTLIELQNSISKSNNSAISSDDIDYNLLRELSAIYLLNIYSNTVICFLPSLGINGSLYVDDFVCYSSKNMSTIERKIHVSTRY